MAPFGYHIAMPSRPTHPARPFIANDNEKLPVIGSVYRSGPPSHGDRRVSVLLQASNESQNTKPAPHSTISPIWDVLVFVALGLWGAVAIMLWAGAMDMPVTAARAFPLILLGLIMAGCGASLFLRYRRPVLATIASIWAFIGIALSLSVFASAESAAITLSDSLAIFAFASLALSYLLRSRTALGISVLAALSWLLGDASFVAPAGYTLCLLPLLWSLQVQKAAQIKSLSVLFSTLVLGYLAVFYALLKAYALGAIDIPMALITVILIGTIQNRIGRTAEDQGGFGAKLNRDWGWAVVSLAGLIMAGLFILPGLASFTQEPVTALGLAGWNLLSALLVMGVFLASLMRWRAQRITVWGVVLITLLAATLPVIISQVSLFEAFMSAQLGLPLMPNFGLIIAGLMTARGFAYTVNGFRRDETLMIVLGMVTIGASVVLIGTTASLTIDQLLLVLIAFATGLTLSLILGYGSLKSQLIEKPVEWARTQKGAMIMPPT